MTSTADFYYLALDPSPPFAAWLQARKEQLRSLVGEQRYLNDPPHLTLYVAAFDDPGGFATALNALALGDLGSLEARMRGWHVFFQDAATGGNTLVCDLDASDDAALRRLQSTAAAALAPLRNVEATAARYVASLAGFGTHERKSFDTFGFPYVGPIWRPHLTVASVAPRDWDIVRQAFEPVPPFAEPIVLTKLVLRRVCDSAAIHTIELE